MRTGLITLALWGICLATFASNASPASEKLLPPKTFGTMGSAYRFHDKDPVFFQKGLRLACKVGEKIDGRVFHRVPDSTEYTAYVWTYEW